MKKITEIIRNHIRIETDTAVYRISLQNDELDQGLVITKIGRNEPDSMTIKPNCSNQIRIR